MTKSIQIKVSPKTKEKLDELKDETETYNNIVTRLISENQELKKDKEFLTETTRKLLLNLVISKGADEIQDQDDLKNVLKSLMTPEPEQ